MGTTQNLLTNCGIPPSPCRRGIACPPEWNAGRSEIKKMTPPLSSPIGEEWR